MVTTDPQHRPISRFLTRSQSPSSITPSFPAPLPPHAPLPGYSREAAWFNHALQRNAPRVTLAASCLRLSSTTQSARRAPQSLSLGR
ncbi:MAG: hypothetical protein WCK17_18340 [Verrucomicrobiota bacterium]